MGIPFRTLIIEDSEDDALLLIRMLQKGGYDPAYERVETADAMAESLGREAMGHHPIRLQHASFQWFCSPHIV